MFDADPFDILGVSRGASDSEIKSAYRKLAHKYHPDKNKEPDAAERFRLVNEAYEVLTDKQKRKNFESYGDANPEPGDIFSDRIEDIFEDIFGSVLRSNRGADIQAQISLTLEECLSGTTKAVEITRIEPCQRCSGVGGIGHRYRCNGCMGHGVKRLSSSFSITTDCDECAGRGMKFSHPCKFCLGLGNEKRRIVFDVEVPPGTTDELLLRIPGEGDRGERNGPSGDLLVHVKVEHHPQFQRKGLDIYSRIRVSESVARDGGRAKVLTLRGIIAIHVPHSMESGEKIRLAGYGLPSVDGGRNGDHYMVIEVTR